MKDDADGVCDSDNCGVGEDAELSWESWTLSSISARLLWVKIYWKEKQEKDSFN